MLISLIGHEIYFLSSVVIYLKIVTHIKEFIINDVFKIVSEIIPVVHNADGIQSDIGEAQSPVGFALIDQAKRDQGFNSPMLHHLAVHLQRSLGHKLVYFD